MADDTPTTSTRPRNTGMRAAGRARMPTTGRGRGDPRHRRSQDTFGCLMGGLFLFPMLYVFGRLLGIW